MNRLSKDDLSQMSRDYFQSLDKEKLVEVAGNLHAFAFVQLERLEQNSSNSSRPPSSDSPFDSETVEFDSGKTQIANQEKSLTDTEDLEAQKVSDNQKEKSKAEGFGKKLQGLQIGAKGMWRTSPLVPSITIPHYPENCALIQCSCCFWIR
jgi:hypothetical protein